MMPARRWLLIGATLVVALVAFLLFRPDTLFTDVEADESLEDAFVTTIAEASTTTGAPPATTTTIGPEVSTTEAASSPRQVSVGGFYGIDHSAAGTAAVYEQDGRYVLRFEDDTDIQNGPDLYVWVLASDTYESGTPGEYIDLGTLEGNVGGQNYDLPGEFDPEVHRFVLIWCLRFAVPFAGAPLA
jgi:Electron transfer DM13